MLKEITGEEVLDSALDRTDPYLSFSGPLYDTTPKEFLPLLDTIRRESEWRALGVRIKSDRYGNYKPIVRRGLYFGFTLVVVPDEIELEGIRTKKKCTAYPASVADYLSYGFSYDDFAYISEDVKAYCEALSSDQPEEAIAMITRAIELKPNENLYNDLFIDIKLRMNDLSAIDYEIAYYINDIDSLVHSGRMAERLEKLISERRYAKAGDFIKTVNDALDDLIAGRRTNARFAGQSVWFAESKKEEFNSRLTKSIKFTTAQTIIERHSYSDELLALMELIFLFEGFHNMPFIERLADVLVVWGKPLLAFPYYERVFESLTRDNKPRLAQRVQKKIDRISTLTASP